MCGHPNVTLIGLADPAVYETEPCSVNANTSQASVVPLTLISYVKALRVQHSSGYATTLPSLQPPAIIHSFNEINSLETYVLQILQLCLTSSIFFDVDDFRIIR
jgi:hypothetical protein